MQSFDTKTDDAAPSAIPSQTFVVGGIDDLRPGACHRLELPDGNELAVLNVNGEYYAIDNFCPHKGRRYRREVSAGMWLSVAGMDGSLTCAAASV